jgi:hypothetical protein
MLIGGGVVARRGSRDLAGDDDASGRDQDRHLIQRRHEITGFVWVQDI